MAYNHSNDSNGADGGSGGVGDYSGDERESRSGSEERLDTDLNDKPIYLLEHLATFTVNKDSGIVYPADGMRRLLQLEKTTGIWSQKMQLCLDYGWVLIMDYETGNIIERFPASLIQEPTAFTSTDSMELYNNILVFIVSGGSGSRSEMHIFQSQSVSAVQLVEDLKNLRNGKLVTLREGALQQQHKSTSSLGMNRSGIVSRSEHQHHHHHLRYHQGTGGATTVQQHQPQPQRGNAESHGPYGLRSNGSGRSGGPDHAVIAETDSEHGGLNDEISSTSSDKYERDVTVLNHCFDDIEKFIARLQHAAAALRELERRRRNRKSKKKDPGEGLLTLRTRPPHEKEFIDIFAKFKLSFNLLAKLKAHIHDPNAPELVHFLFTPLALIVEAANDNYYESQLPVNVVNPLLTREAINLLVNCVTSKETELWRSLGDTWIVPRDQWKDDVGSYHPVFLDGWSPDYLVVDELEPLQTAISVSKRRKEGSPAHHHVVEGVLNGRNMKSAALPMNYDDYDNALSEKFIVQYGNERMDRLIFSNVGDGGGGGLNDFSTRSEISVDSTERGGNGTGPNHVMITSGMQNLHMRDGRNMSATGGNSFVIDPIEAKSNLGIGDTVTGAVEGGVEAPEIGVSSGSHPGLSAGDEHMLEQWLIDLQATGAKIVLVTHPRTANNDKELSVARGEYLEILDDSRKWWKTRNIRGQIAHVPHTIVTPYFYGDGENSNLLYGQLQQRHYQPSSSKLRHVSANANSMEQRPSDTSSEWIRNTHLGKKGEFRYF